MTGWFLDHGNKGMRGCEFTYLPAYSPDYDPIEEAFAKIKNLLRMAAARTKEALV